MVDPSTSAGAAALCEIGGGRGVDIGIDASGTDAGVNLALGATKDKGAFIFAAVGHKATINPWLQFLEKELVAYGVWYFVDRNYFGLFDLYRQGLSVSDLITHRFSLEEASVAYTLFARGETGKCSSLPTGRHGNGADNDSPRVLDARIPL